MFQPTIWILRIVRCLPLIRWFIAAKITGFPNWMDLATTASPGILKDHDLVSLEADTQKRYDILGGRTR